MSGRASQVVFTCPASITTIVKSVYFTVGATPALAQFVVARVNGPSIYFAQVKLDATTGNSGKWEGWLVLEPSDQIIAGSDVSVIVSWGSGAKLPLSP